MSFLEDYLTQIRNSGKTELATSVEDTVNKIVPEYIENFSYREHVTALLAGEVQSGKTAHMFGLMCATADNGFCFRNNATKRPVLIVLKKNTRELKQWRNNLAESRICTGNPLFIADDAADTASLNTQVNQDRPSTINKHLAEIRKTSS